jgi:hypothetical protein
VCTTLLEILEEESLRLCAPAAVSDSFMAVKA